MFNDKIIVIMGISSDIGKVLANKLIDEKAIVIGSYYNNSVNFGKCFYCDVTNEDKVKKFFLNIKKEYGKIDYLINMMTYSNDDDFINKTAGDFMDVVKVNLLGTFLCCKYGVQLMNKGTIINMSSLDGIDTYNYYAMDYAASKSGVNNLTLNFAKRCPNIRFIALAPAWISTKSTLEIEPKYLKEEMEKHGQKKLLTINEVVNKIIDILKSDNILSGIIEMRDSNE